MAWKNSTTTVRSDVSNFSTTFVSASAAEEHRVLLISMQTNEKSSILTCAVLPLIATINVYSEVSTTLWSSGAQFTNCLTIYRKIIVSLS